MNLITGILTGMINEVDRSRFKSGESLVLPVYQSADQALADPDKGAGIVVQVGNVYSLLDWKNDAWKFIKDCFLADVYKDKARKLLRELAEIEQGVK